MGGPAPGATSVPRTLPDLDSSLGPARPGPWEARDQGSGPAPCKQEELSKHLPGKCERENHLATAPKYPWRPCPSRVPRNQAVLRSLRAPRVTSQCLGTRQAGEPWVQGPFAGQEDSGHQQTGQGGKVRWQGWGSPRPELPCGVGDSISWLWSPGAEDSLREALGSCWENSGCSAGLCLT